MSMGVAAYHVIITNYGFWLPNDPRGSWSDFVRSWEIYLAGGPATGTDTRRSVAGVSHNARQRLVAKNALVRDPVVWTGVQAKAVGDGFARFVAKSALNIFACAIMPRHTHLVFERTTYLAEQVTNLLKGEATKELNRCDLHPFRDFGYSNGKLPSP
jgi:hypothetical protein